MRGKCLLGWDDDGVEDVVVVSSGEALPVDAVSRAIDRVEVTFDDPNLVANAGLLVVATGRSGCCRSG